MSPYVPTNCSSDSIKDSVYYRLCTLLPRAECLDIVVVAGDIKAYVGRLSASKASLIRRVGLDAGSTNFGGRILQFCTNDKIIFSNTNLRNKRPRLAQMPFFNKPNLYSNWPHCRFIPISWLCHRIPLLLEYIFWLWPFARSMPILVTFSWSLESACVTHSSW